MRLALSFPLGSVGTHPWKPVSLRKSTYSQSFALVTCGRKDAECTQMPRTQCSTHFVIQCRSSAISFSLLSISLVFRQSFSSIRSTSSSVANISRNRNETCPKGHWMIFKWLAQAHNKQGECQHWRKTQLDAGSQDSLPSPAPLAMARPWSSQIVARSWHWLCMSDEPSTMNTRWIARLSSWAHESIVTVTYLIIHSYGSGLGGGLEGPRLKYFVRGGAVEFSHVLPSSECFIDFRKQFKHERHGMNISVFGL